MKTNMAVIRLKDLRFHARHGVLPQERDTGGEFIVNVELALAPTDGVFACDRLDRTVNYATVYDLVKREMLTPSQLIEHVCRRIAKAVLDTLPMAETVRVSVCKGTPPITSFTGSAEAEISLSRH